MACYQQLHRHHFLLCILMVRTKMFVLRQGKEVSQSILFSKCLSPGHRHRTAFRWILCQEQEIPVQRELRRMESSTDQLKGFCQVMVVLGVLFCTLSITVRADNPRTRYDESQTPFMLMAPVHINNVVCALTS